MKLFYLFCAILLVFSPISAQKYLQIEKYGSVKTTKLPIGTTITFRLNGANEHWRTEKIAELYLDNGLMLTEQGIVKISTIAAFQEQRVLPSVLGNKLMQFGAAWLLYGGLAHLVDYRYSAGDFILAGSTIGGGYLLKKTLTTYQVRFGKRKWLRIVDLSFKK
jgi:hypothetical protein